MERNIGFIGCGNMAKAMIGGILRAGLIAPQQVYVSNPSPEKLEQIKKEYGVNICHDNHVPASQCSILFLSVKPYLYPNIIDEIRETISENAIIVMIAAGQSIQKNEARFQRPVKLIKAMPNTPAMVGEGMTAVCFNSQVTEPEKDEIRALLAGFGKVEDVPETMMDAVTGVSGSSPAYVYLFIEALADGAVREGMPRKQAYTFAAQSVLGAAKMVLQTGEHPGVLKDKVCSPGGTTIEAVAALETGGMRAAVLHAVEICCEKSREMNRS